MCGICEGRAKQIIALSFDGIAVLGDGDEDVGGVLINLIVWFGEKAFTRDGEIGFDVRTILRRVERGVVKISDDLCRADERAEEGNQGEKKCFVQVS